MLDLSLRLVEARIKYFLGMCHYRPLLCRTPLFHYHQETLANLTLQTNFKICTYHSELYQGGAAAATPGGHKRALRAGEPLAQRHTEGWGREGSGRP